MFFRFGIAIGFIVVLALAGAALETANLSLHRDVSRQHYRLNVLLEKQSRLRLQTEQLATPLRTFQSLQDGTIDLRTPQSSDKRATKDASHKTKL